MRLLLINLLTLLIVNLPIFAQHIYTCRSHTEDGQPLDADIVWDIRPFGENVDILFDNGNEPITEPILYLLIDKQGKDDEEYHPYDSRAIHVEDNQTWVVENYKLTEAGEYEIFIMDSDRERLATIRITVNVEDEFGPEEESFSNIYYDNSNLVFCQLVINNIPINIRNTISMADGGSTYVYLKSDHPFNTSKLIVNIWKKAFSSFDYDVFVESKKYKMSPEWPDVFFNYQFQEPGRYKVSVYNENEMLIKFGFITVSE